MCAVWDNTTINLTMCKTDNICRIPYETNNKGICTHKYEYPTRVPGEYCYNSTQCLYGNKCEDNICRGKTEGTCITHGECDIGYYCRKRVCTKHTLECNNEMLCDSNRVCNNSKCVIIGKIKDGENAEVPAACRSYYVKKGKCMKGPKLAASFENGICKYKIEGPNGTDYFFDSAVCNLNSTGTNFCPLGVGDRDLEHVIFTLL